MTGTPSVVRDHLKMLVGDVLRDDSDNLLVARTLRHDTDLLFG